MSYDERDAWIDEKASGEWPFARWDIGPLRLRDGFKYFSYPMGVSGLGSIHHRLLHVLGWPRISEERLKELLGEVEAVIETAIEHSDIDAYESWLQHEVWLPVLDDSLNGSESPADLLSQAIDYVGVHDEVSERELLAALGLWLLGELETLTGRDDWRHKELLVQIAVALAGAEYYRGRDDFQLEVAKKATKRSQAATDARHAANRARTQEAREWWLSQGAALSAAEAAREVSRRFHVVEDVAKRWVRQFRRQQSK
jgi:hypothetical protein